VCAISTAEHESRFNAGSRCIATARVHNVRRSQGTPHFPMAVLVNEGQASARRSLAAPSKTCIARLSWAKQLSERLCPKCDAIARWIGLRFTTAKYYTPSKQVIHGNGVTPNIRVPMSVRAGKAAFHGAEAAATQFSRTKTRISLKARIRRCCARSTRSKA